MRLLIVILLAVLAIGRLSALELDARSGYVVHPQTRTVLVSQNADTRMGPASLTKMMTLYLLFEALENGQVKLTDEFPVSEKAWRMGGSKMFVKVGNAVPVESLIRGISIVSGNDACVVVAEKLGGSEEAFAEQMSRKAQQLGMVNTHFANASGWPDPAQHTTAHDIGILLTALLNDFPKYKSYLTEREFTWNGIKQQNRNRLLDMGVGIDIGKTGHTEESGYHLASSAVQRGERLVVVVMGTEGFSQREGESLKAYNHFFAQNRTHTVAKPGALVVQNVPVWHGRQRTTALTVAEPLAAFMSAQDMEAATVKASYNQPLVAPFSPDTVIGEIILTLPTGQTMKAPLVPAQTVQRAGFFGRWWQNFNGMFGG